MDEKETRVGMGSRQAPPAGSSAAAAQDAADRLPDGAPAGLKDAARGNGLDSDTGDAEADRRAGDQAEGGALDFLLGQPKAVEYDVPVFFDTPDGRKRLTFHIRQLDGSRILSLEKANRKGSGPFAELDDIRFNAALVAAAADYIEEGGRRVAVASSEFAATWRDPALAMEKRFEFQPGLLDGLAGQIRSVSGYSPDRVESAERSVVNAAGN